MTGFRWRSPAARRVTAARILALAAVSLTLSHTASVAGADPDLRIGGIGLSTSLNAFVERYPEARIERFEAVRFCLGEAVAIAPLLRVAGSVTVANRRLEVEFRRRGDALRAMRVSAERILPVEPPDYAAIRAEMVARHGAYDRRIVHRKMEPAGLLFGFEWQRGETAMLRVTVHRDHSAASGHLIETALLTDQLPGMRPAVEAATRNRRVIGQFHRTCAQHRAATRGAS
jgi:hypothetical protein